MLFTLCEHHPSAGLCTTSFSKLFSPWERTPAAADPLHTNYCLKNHTQCWVISLFIYTFTILQINKAYSKGFVFFKIAPFHAHAPVSTRNKLNLNSYIECISIHFKRKVLTFLATYTTCFLQFTIIYIGTVMM